MKTEKDLQIQGLFDAAGARHGFDAVDARFYPFKEFKSTWVRSGRRAELRVTDYLKCADDAILEDFVGCLCARILSRGRREVYTDRLRAWLTSDEFVARNQPLYLSRSRNLTLSGAGSTIDLEAMRDRLRDEGLIQDAADAYLSWTISGNRHRVGYCSVIMKVIAVSSALDCSAVPDFVSEYVLYHELLHLETGLEGLAAAHGADFRRRERLHPHWREAEDFLKKLARRTTSIGSPLSDARLASRGR